MRNREKWVALIVVLLLSFYAMCCQGCGTVKGFGNDLEWGSDATKAAIQNYADNQ